MSKYTNLECLWFEWHSRGCSVPNLLDCAWEPTVWGKHFPYTNLWPPNSPWGILQLGNPFSHLLIEDLNLFSHFKLEPRCRLVWGQGESLLVALHRRRGGRLGWLCILAYCTFRGSVNLLSPSLKRMAVVPSVSGDRTVYAKSPHTPDGGTPNLFPRIQTLGVETKNQAMPSWCS